MRLPLCHAVLSHGNISRLCKMQGRQPWSLQKLPGSPLIDDTCDVILQAGPSGHAALLHVDLSLPFQVRGRREPPAEQLPLLRLQDGSVQVRNERQRSDPGRQPSLQSIALPC